MERLLAGEHEGSDEARLGKRVILQSSLDPRSVERWLGLIGDPGRSPARSVAVDYERYGAGEKRLAWYDASVIVRTGESAGGDSREGAREDGGREAVRALVEEIRRAVHEMKGPAAHVKVLVEHADGTCKESLTSADDRPPEIPAITGPLLAVTVNARVETDAAVLQSAMRAAFERAARRGGMQVQVTEEQSFHPARPVPFERIP